MNQRGEQPLPAGVLLERSLADALAGDRWDVEVEPLLGTVRLDLFAVAPAGGSFVIEVKAERGSVHFATIARVASFVKLAQDTRRLADVRGVLCTTGRVHAEARDAAKSLDVHLLGPTETEYWNEEVDVARDRSRLESLARSWAEELSRLAARSSPP